MLPEFLISGGAVIWVVLRKSILGQNTKPFFMVNFQIATFNSFIKIFL